jgi:uncharacterized glyoxalase superfamily protein PhnB
MFKYLAVGLKVSHFLESFEFYTEVLGFEATEFDKENEFAEVRLDNLRLALLTKDTLVNMCGVKHFALNKRSNHLIALQVDNLEEAYQELKCKGVAFIQEPKTTSWGQKVAYFKDLEGCIWEISEK